MRSGSNFKSLPKDRTLGLDLDVIWARLKTQDVCEFEVDGISLVVLPGVFSPQYSESPDYLMKHAKIKPGCSVLDLGCGCGILSLWAANQGAEKVVALDINESALQNTKLNAMHHHLQNKIEVRWSNGFEAIKKEEKFDVILWNPPFYNRVFNNDLERACFDPDYQFFKASIQSAKKVLNNNGTLQLVFGETGGFEVIEHEIKLNEWNTVRTIVQDSGRNGYFRKFYELNLINQD